MPDPADVFILLVTGVAAGWMNVMAGGGSLLSVPVMLFLGLPGPVANGTNRIAILAQNTVAVATFRKRGIGDYRLGASLAVAATIGAIGGAMIGVHLVGVWFNRALAAVMVLVLITMAWPRKKGIPLDPPLEKGEDATAGDRTSQEGEHVTSLNPTPSAKGEDTTAAGNRTGEKGQNPIHVDPAAEQWKGVGGPGLGQSNISTGKLVVAHILMIGAGAWGGFIQVGVGFLLMPILHKVLGLDLVRVNAMKVLIVLTYTTAALAVFASNVQIAWSLGLALAAGNAIGGWAGAHTTVTRGENWIKAVFYAALVALVIKLVV